MNNEPTDWAKIPLETMREIFGADVGELFFEHIHAPEPVDPNMRVRIWDAEKQEWIP